MKEYNVGCPVEIEKGQYVFCRDTIIGNELCSKCKEKELSQQEDENV